MRLFALALAVLAAARGAAAPPMPASPEELEADLKLSYAELHARALKEDRALIIWIGMAARTEYHPFALHCEDGSAFPSVRRGIIVSRPERGELMWLATLPADAPPEAIWEVLNRGLPGFSTRSIDPTFDQADSMRDCRP
jgi:hypothetical protein